MRYIVLAVLWLIRWTAKLVGWFLVILGWPLILAKGFGLLLILVGLFIKDEIPWFCTDLATAIKAGGVKTPLQAAQFELDWWVPFWNGRTTTILPVGEDTGQADLGYSGARQVVTDRLLAKNFCPRCHVFRWDREEAPVPPSCQCRYCGTDMEPVYEHRNGKPVHPSESRVSSTGTSWGASTTTLD